MEDHRRLYIAGRWAVPNADDGISIATGGRLQRDGVVREPHTPSPIRTRPLSSGDRGQWLTMRVCCASVGTTRCGSRRWSTRPLCPVVAFCGGSGVTPVFSAARSPFLHPPMKNLVESLAAMYLGETTH